MSQISLIIITGFPGTGKTTLGRRLAEELQLPFVCKDDIKELLFDNLGWKDREWSKKVGGSSYDLLYYIAELFLKSGQSLIVETNFSPKAIASKKFLDLKKKYNFKPLQIRCFADGKILLSRFTKRAANPDERHPGHVDSELMNEIHPMLMREKIETLDIGGEILDIDTSDFDKVDFAMLVSNIKLAVGIS